MSEPYILVTGATGYIGSQMIYLLNSLKIKTLAVDKKNARTPKYPYINFHKLDITDKKAREHLFSTYEIKSVIHFAGEIHVAESIENPEKYFMQNTMASLLLLQTMRKYNCREFIFSSTAAVYGEPNTQSITENHPTHPINPYGQSKLMVEQMLESYRLAGQMNYVCLRYFNAAGANLGAGIGEQHEPETHLIPLFLAALEGLRPLAYIFGTNYDTPDGTCIRDFIHIKDLATAHYQALQWLRKTNHSNIFNLGTGQGISVKTIADKIQEISNKKLTLMNAKARAGDPSYLVANIDKAKHVLNWEPEHSAIEEILNDAWTFLKMCMVNSSSVEKQKVL